jgi:hypothetical protein
MKHRGRSATFGHNQSLPKTGMCFRVVSCELVDRRLRHDNKGDPRNHTKHHETYVSDKGPSEKTGSYMLYEFLHVLIKLN